MPFLHLVAGTFAAKVINQTLRALGRDEEALGDRDVLAEGPLHDIDRGGAARIAWWGRLKGASLPDDEARGLVDPELWDRAQRWNGDIVVWHGPHPSERLFVLRACHRLRETPSRLYEVAIHPKPRHAYSPGFYGAVALSDTERLVAAWPTRSKIEDVVMRAQRWEALSASAGETVRSLEGDDLVLHPLSVYDDELVATCKGEWVASLNVVGNVLAANSTTDGFLRWRVRELLRERVLQGRGSVNRLGLPEEVRPSPARH